MRILIADDHPIVRHGLKQMLANDPAATVVGEATNGDEALEMARKLEWDMAIFDFSMPGRSGLDLLGDIKKEFPGKPVLILSMHSDAEHVYRAFAAGASGYLLKGSASEEIVAALRAVLKGQHYLSRELAHIDWERGDRSDERGPLESLSLRERQVLQLVVEGHSSAAIAGLVNLSSKSVDTYRSRLMKKLGVSDVPGLVKFAIQHGLTPAD